jgi:tetratricopeptide (TPR) repeat protein
MRKVNFIRVDGKQVSLSLERVTLGILIILALVGSVLIFESWSVNRWSLSYARNRIGTDTFHRNNLMMMQNHHRSQVWIARDYYQQKRYLESLELINHLLDVDDYLAVSLKGDVLLAMGDDLEAINAFAQAGDVNALSKIARKAFKNEDLYVAFLANEEVCRIALDDSNSCLEVGKYLIDQGYYSEADKYLELAIQRDPNRRGTYLTRANALRKNGAYSDAIGVYRLALTRFPDFEQVYFELSSTYDLNNQSDEARQAIDLALSVVPHPTEKYLLMAGRIYENGGANQKALATYRRVLEINPNNQVAQKAIKRIDK